MAKTCDWCEYTRSFICNGEHCGLCAKGNTDEREKGFDHDKSE